jgi:hypothetical protein
VEAQHIGGAQMTGEEDCAGKGSVASRAFMPQKGSCILRRSTLYTFPAHFIHTKKAQTVNQREPLKSFWTRKNATKKPYCWVVPRSYFDSFHFTNFVGCQELFSFIHILIE